uniref:Uncharacterized protein n=1 Tax=Geobacter sp. (strain M21) TaxID=443144 RepID=C6E6U7_GEOSM
MDWYKIRITREDQLRGKTEQLVGEIRELFRLLDGDPALAVYSATVNDQAVDLYFSPAAAALAGKIIHHHWGIPCDPPPTGAKHLFGSPAVVNVP